MLQEKTNQANEKKTKNTVSAFSVAAVPANDRLGRGGKEVGVTLKKGCWYNINTPARQFRPGNFTQGNYTTT